MKSIFTFSLLLFAVLSLSAQDLESKVAGKEPKPLSAVELKAKLSTELNELESKKIELEGQLVPATRIEDRFRFKAQIKQVDQAIHNRKRMLSGEAVQLGRSIEKEN